MTSSNNINCQVIEQDGTPAFAVVPFKDFLRLIKPEPTIPHEVVGLVVKKDISITRAWREYLKLTQQEAAKKTGITQAALSQIEKKGSTPHKATLAKLAKAYGIEPEQIEE
ncbi:MAG: helix-turn-helix transcriptional regulator [Victivallales bacterium]